MKIMALEAFMTLAHRLRNMCHPGLFMVFSLLSCAAPQRADVLLLPEDAETLEGLMYTGTTELPDLSGLSRVRVPGSETPYYVIDRQTAAHKWIMGDLARMPPGAYISITQDQLLWSRVVHLQTDDSNVPVVRYLVFENSLLGQLAEFFAETESPEEAGTVEYREYAFRVDGCEGLSASIVTMESALKEAVQNIGPGSSSRSGVFENIMIDGPRYDVQVRMGSLIGSFSAGGSGSMYDAVEATLFLIRDCSAKHEGTVRETGFYDTHSSY